MAEREWSKKQSEVINHRGSDLIVSAAAGSGKTTVLVERILGLITDEEDPVDIDDILVVTFTNAAATDMKTKIAQEIDRRLSEDPTNGRLSLQSALVSNAIITTIDSFCGYVVKNYFSVIGLEPGYKVGEEEELSIMAEEVLDEVMKEFYAGDDKDFKKLVRAYGKAKGDTNIRDMVKKLCRNSECHTDPSLWLEEITHCYDTDDLEDQPWMKELTGLIKNDLKNAVEESKRGLALCEAEGGPSQYKDNFSADIDMLEKFLEKESYGEMYDYAAKEFSFGRLSGKKGENVDEDLKDKAKKIREAVKKSVSDMTKKYLSLSPAKQKANLKKAKPLVEALSRVSIAYTEKLMAEKKRQKLYGFSDIEHFALDILTHEETNADGTVTCPVACAFGRKFKEVMIDEYQDSNDVQETILSRISLASKGRCKRFMVGDVKQSIYGFRLAKPEIFLEKEAEFSDPSNDKKRIALSENYRSRASVLDSTNAVFESIMKPDTANIDYDEDARLHLGRKDFPVDVMGITKTELLLGYMDDGDGSPDNTGDDGDDDRDNGDDVQEEDVLNPKDIDKLTFEAKMIANRIIKLKELRDEEGKPVFKNSDIAILGRSFKKTADILLRELGNAGIKAHLTRDTGYFSEPEIKNVMTMLEVIDNPLVDIPLYGALVSYFGGMRPDELAKVRVFAVENMPGTRLYDQICRYSEEGEEEKIRRKLADFLRMLDAYRKVSVDTAVRDLIDMLLTDTGYRDFISAKPAGKKRLANLDMLENIAAKYDENTAGGLVRFVRHIRQMRTFDMDYGEADNVSESDDVVRIMTIHKSKGLQFKAVILAGTDAKFSTSDKRAVLKCSEKYGAAIKAVDAARRIKYKNILGDVIDSLADRAQRAEEMRVLYVAMTRAEEKLIICGPVRPEDKRADDGESCAGISNYDIMKANCFAGWIEPVARSRRDLFDIAEYSIKDLETADMERTEKRILNTAAVLELGNTENALTEDVRQRISFEYKYTDDVLLRQKVSVSEVKKPDYEKQMEEEGCDEFIKRERKKYIPKFVSPDQQEEGSHGAAYGTSVHRFMELLDYGALSSGESDYDADLKKMMKNICDEGLMDAEACEAINTGRIARFLRSDLGREMKRAFDEDTLRREAPFVMELPATEIYPDVCTDEAILVQGIIDAYYVREDGIVVVDYKTDRLESEDLFIEKYHRQLELYAKALSKAMEKPVAGMYIYSFGLGKKIEIPAV